MLNFENEDDDDTANEILEKIYGTVCHLYEYEGHHSITAFTYLRGYALTYCLAPYAFKVELMDCEQEKLTLKKMSKQTISYIESPLTNKITKYEVSQNIYLPKWQATFYRATPTSLSILFALRCRTQNIRVAFRYQVKTYSYDSECKFYLASIPPPPDTYTLTSYTNAKRKSSGAIKVHRNITRFVFSRVPDALRKYLSQKHDIFIARQIHVPVVVIKWNPYRHNCFTKPQNKKKNQLDRFICLVNDKNIDKKKSYELYELSQNGSVASDAVSVISKTLSATSTELLTKNLAGPIAKHIRHFTYAVWAFLATDILRLILRVIRIFRFGWDAQMGIEFALDVSSLIGHAVLQFGLMKMITADSIQKMSAMIKDLVVEQLSNKQFFFSPPGSQYESVESNQAGISVQTCIGLVIGIMSLGLTIGTLAGFKGPQAAGKRLVDCNAIRKAATESATSAKDLVYAISEECFGYNMSPFANLRTSLSTMVRELDEYNQYSQFMYAKDVTLYYRLRTAVIKAESLYTSVTKQNNTLENSVLNSLTLLNQSISVAKIKRDKIGEALASGGPRVETAMFHVVGRRGCGKTYALNNILIPEICRKFGWREGTYGINFSGQVYWPPYAGQPIGIYDEFLGTKEEDPIIPNLNLLGSTGHCNLPGAELVYKFQPCYMKALFLVSNQHYVDLGNKLTPTAAEAVYSRFRRYEFINTRQSVTDDHSRFGVYHSETLEEMEIRKYITNANKNSRVAVGGTRNPKRGQVYSLPNGDQYTIITPEEFVIDVCAIVQSNMDLFRKQDPEAASKDIETTLAATFRPDLDLEETKEGGDEDKLFRQLSIQKHLESELKARRKAVSSTSSASQTSIQASLNSNVSSLNTVESTTSESASSTSSDASVPLHQPGQIIETHQRPALYTIGEEESSSDETIESNQMQLLPDEIAHIYRSLPATSNVRPSRPLTYDRKMFIAEGRHTFGQKSDRWYETNLHPYYEFCFSRGFERCYRHTLQEVAKLRKLLNDPKRWANIPYEINDEFDYIRECRMNLPDMRDMEPVEVTDYRTSAMSTGFHYVGGRVYKVGGIEYYGRSAGKCTIKFHGKMIKDKGKHMISTFMPCTIIENRIEYPGFSFCMLYDEFPGITSSYKLEDVMTYPTILLSLQIKNAFRNSKVHLRFAEILCRWFAKEDKDQIRRIENYLMTLEDKGMSNYDLPIGVLDDLKYWACEELDFDSTKLSMRLENINHFNYNPHEYFYLISEIHPMFHMLFRNLFKSGRDVNLWHYSLMRKMENLVKGNSFYLNPITYVQLLNLHRILPQDMYKKFGPMFAFHKLVKCYQEAYFHVQSPFEKHATIRNLPYGHMEGFESPPDYYLDMCDKRAGRKVRAHYIPEISWPIMHFDEDVPEEWVGINVKWNQETYWFIMEEVLKLKKQRLNIRTIADIFEGIPLAGPNVGWQQALSYSLPVAGKYPPEVVVNIEGCEKIEFNQSSDSQYENYVVHFYGEPGSGKSFKSRQVAAKLSKIFKMPIFEVTQGDLSKIMPSPVPSIYVLHDQLADERAYVQFYDTVVKPSIIILSSNIKVSSTYAWAQYETGTGLYSLLKIPMNIYYYLKAEASKISGKSQVNKEPGFIRRIGITGVLKHQGQTSYRSEQMGSLIRFETGRRMYMVQSRTTEEVTDNDVMLKIITDFRRLYQQHGNIIFTKVDDLSSITNADVLVEAPNSKKLRECVNDVGKVLKAFYNSHRGNPTEVNIEISDRVINSTFQFTPHMFHLGREDKIPTEEELKALAERTYSTLRTADTDFTALIKTSDFTAFCVRGEIQYCTNSLPIPYVFSHSISDQSGVKMITISKSDQDGEVDSQTYKMEEVVNALVNGFHKVKSIEEQEYVNYLITNEKLILDAPEAKIFLNQVKILSITGKTIQDQRNIFLVIWDKFVNSKVFRVISLFLVILLSLSVLWSLFSSIYNFFKPDKSDFQKLSNGVKLPSSITVGGCVFEASYTISGDKVNVLLETSSTDSDYDRDEVHETLEEVIENETDGRYYLVGINYQHRQSEYTKNQKHGKRSGKNAITTKRGARNQVEKTQSSIPIANLEEVQNDIRSSYIMKDHNFNTQTAISVRTKCAQNQVVVVVGGKAVYGLGYKNRYILCPAHTIRKQDVRQRDAVTVIYRKKLKSGVINQFTTSEVQVQYLDYDNDLAVLHIDQPEFPNFTDISNYFITEEKTSKVFGAYLMCRARQANDSITNAILSEEWLIQAGIVEHTHTKYSSITGDGIRLDHTAPSFGYERFSGQSFGTRPGDCGSVYLASSVSLDYEIILGLHLTARDAQSLSTRSNCLTKEFLANVFNHLVEPTYSLLGPHRIEKTQDSSTLDDMLIKLDLSVYHPAVEDFVDVYTDEFYESIFDLPYPAMYDQDLWWDEEFTESTLGLIGRSDKFKPLHLGKHAHHPTPWSTKLQLPNKSCLSVTSYKQLPKFEADKLHTLRGRPSVVAEQLSFYNDPIKFGKTAKRLMNVASGILRKQYDIIYKGPHRVLTNLEAINGIYFDKRDPYYGGLDALDMSSSIGDYGIRKHGLTRKSEIFKEIECEDSIRKVYGWKSTPKAMDIQYRCDVYERMALTGKRLMTVARDNLKHEVVNKPKARAFQSMSIEEVLCMRKYTGTLQAAMVTRHMEGHCQIGIDPLTQFHWLMDRMRDVGNIGEAGDFSRWDKHMLAPCIREGMDILCELMCNYLPKETDKEAVRNVFRVFAHSIIYTIVECEGFYYVKTRGIPSGVAVTAMLNCTINELYTLMSVQFLLDRYFYYEKTDNLEGLKQYFGKGAKFLPEGYLPEQLTHKWFYKNFDFAVYGDDKFTVINPRIAQIFNFKSFKKFYKDVLGITYDTPRKDGFEYKYCGLHEIEFLSRTMTVEDGVVFPALKKETIISLLHWSRQHQIEHYEDLLTDCLEEAALWDREFYESICKDVAIAISYLSRQAGRTIRVILTPYDRKRNELRAKILHGRNSEKSLRTSLKNFSHKNEVRVPGLCRLKDISNTIQVEELCQMQSQFTVEEAMDLMKAHFELDYTKLGLVAIKSIYNCPAVTFDGYRGYGSIYFDYHPGVPRNYYMSDLQKIINAANKKGLRNYAIKNFFDVYRRIGPEILPILSTTIIPDFTILRPSVTHPHAVLKQLQRTDLSEFNQDGCYLFQKSNKVKFQIKQFDKHGLNEIVLREDLYKTSDDVQADSGINSGRSDVQDGKNQKPSNENVLPIERHHMPPKVFNYSPWVDDMKALAHKPMVTVGSPITIAVNQPAGTVVDVVSLGELSTMSRAMRIWASVNSECCATIVYSYKFVTAATIINELIFGLAVQKKASYTEDELQIIEWKAINPQEQTATIELNLAPVTSDRLMPNRYTFSETIATGTFVPTLVILTRVPIQNSYANDNVSINVIRMAHFANHTEGPSAFRATAEDLEAGSLNSTSKTIIDATTSTTTTMSDLLRLPQGRPFQITCDGGIAKVDELAPNTALSYTAITGKVNFSPQYTFGINSSLDPTSITDYTSIASFSLKQNNPMCWYMPMFTPILQTRSYTNAAGDRTYLDYNSFKKIALKTSSNPDETARGIMRGLAASGLAYPVTDLLIYEAFGRPIPALPDDAMSIKFGEKLTYNGMNRIAFNYRTALEASDVTSYRGEMITRMCNNWADQGWAYVITQTDSFTEAVGTASTYDHTFSSRYQSIQNSDATGSAGVGYSMNYDITGVATGETVSQNFYCVNTVKLWHQDLGQRLLIFLTSVDPSSPGDNVSVQIQNLLESVYQVTARLETGQINGYGDGSASSVVGNTGFVGFANVTMSLNIDLTDIDVNTMANRATSLSQSSYFTVNTNQSIINFGTTLATTLPETLAETQSGVEMVDTLFLSNWRQLIRSLGLANADDDNVTIAFTLWNRISSTPMAYVNYEWSEDVFWVLNNPGTDADRYKAYPKLTYEDIRIGNVRRIVTSTGLVTDTSRWASRVVEDVSTAAFNGTRTTKSLASGRKRVVVSINTETTQMENAMLATAGISGAFSGITNILQMIFMSNSVDDRLKQTLANQILQIQEKGAQDRETLQLQAALNGLSSEINMRRYAGTGWFDKSDTESTASSGLPSYTSKGAEEEEIESLIGESTTEQPQQTTTDTPARWVAADDSDSHELQARDRFARENSIRSLKHNTHTPQPQKLDRSQIRAYLANPTSDNTEKKGAISMTHRDNITHGRSRTAQIHADNQIAETTV
ncbi:hypothetical protein [Hubei picorna-like virus 53]|uniref:hypothetical protein n=1 Tax=Hubei picorna-like virus 53 TaxID=1923135 RepID=UPI00090B6441|nr:hypothetical protein [Hubei picorna-like virus 53]APG77918.1 hypothetical protein [Hubei picorna-like virus 53]